MRMKLFHASNQEQIGHLETEVNGWLAALPAPTEIFAVNTAPSITASSIQDAGSVRTLTITVWYYD